MALLMVLAILSAARSAAFQGLPHPDAQQPARQQPGPGAPRGYPAFALGPVGGRAAALVEHQRTSGDGQDALPDLGGLVDSVADAAQDAVDRVSGSLQDVISNATEGVPLIGELADALNEAQGTLAGGLNSTIQSAQDYLSGLLRGDDGEALPLDAAVAGAIINITNMVNRTVHAEGDLNAESTWPLDSAVTDAVASIAEMVNRTVRSAGGHHSAGGRSILGNLSSAEAAIASAVALAVRAAAATAEFKLRVAEADRASEAGMQAVALVWAKANQTVLAGTSAIQATADKLDVNLDIESMLNSTLAAAKAADEAALAAKAAMDAEAYRQAQVVQARAAAKEGIEAGQNFTQDIAVTISSSRTAAELVRDLTSAAAAYTQRE